MKRGLPRNARMIELANKDVKIAITNMLHMFKIMEGNMNMMRKEAENILKIQMELLEMKSTVSEMKTIQCELKSRLDTAKGKINELEDIAI